MQEKELKLLIGGYIDIPGTMFSLEVSSDCSLTSADDRIIVNCGGVITEFKHVVIFYLEHPTGLEPTDTIFTTYNKYIQVNNRAMLISSSSIIYNYCNCLGYTTYPIEDNRNTDVIIAALNSVVSSISITRGDISDIPPILGSITSDLSDYQTAISFELHRHIDPNGKMLAIKVDNLTVDGTLETNASAFLKSNDKVVYNNLGRNMVATITQNEHNRTYYVGVLYNGSHYYRTLPISMLPFEQCDIVKTL